MQLVPWRSLSSAGLVVACASSALAGGYLVVSAFATTVEPFSLGTVAAGATPVIDGRVDVYVPIVDWGVRASPYDDGSDTERTVRELPRVDISPWTSSSRCRRRSRRASTCAVR